MNVVVQPGHWRIPRVDHIGVALDEDDFQSVLGRAMQWNLRVQEHGGRRTFVATNAGYRLEVTRRATGSTSCSRTATSCSSPSSSCGPTSRT